MSYHAETLVLPVSLQALDERIISRAANVLRHGGLVAFPTETVYGLGANALDSVAVSHIFEAKGRPASDPLIVHVASTSQLTEVALDIPPLAWQLVAAFWPGPLTLVLRRGYDVPPNVSAGANTVAVRMPRHPVASALITAAQIPVAAPSANLFARPSPTTAQHVLEDLNGRVDLILDGGPTSIGIESTVLDLTGETPRVLRPGGIPLEQLQAVLPSVTYTSQYLAEQETAAGPGMLLKHYSPRAEMVLFDGPPAATLAALRTQAEAALAAGRRVGAMVVDDDLPALHDLPIEFAPLGQTSDAAAAAQRLFAALRSLDARGVDVIFARSLPRTGLGLAVWDRLVRAAEGRIISVTD
jgi:L-threonylcarbamoyladenylate synthase